MTDRTILVAEEVDLILSEAASLAATGPAFKVLMSRNENGNSRQSRIASAFLMHRAREHHVRLAPSQLRAFYHLGTHRWIGETATQIAAGIANDPMTVLNDRRRQRIARSSVKAFVKGIRRALDIAFQEAGLPLDSRRVLVSEMTSGNQVLYRLLGNVCIVFSRGDQVGRG